MAQEPPEDHKCKDKFLVQSALLPPSLANLPPADIMSEINASDPSQIHQAKLKCVYLPSERVAERQEQVTQSHSVDEHIPVEHKPAVSDSTPKSPKSASEEDEVYENARKRVESLVPEPLYHPEPVAPVAVVAPAAPEPPVSKPVVKPVVGKAPVVEEPKPTPGAAPAVAPAVAPVVAPSTDSQGDNQQLAKENKILHTNLQTANENILSMQKTIDSLKRELTAAQASVLTQRKNESASSTSATTGSRKLASTVKPEDAVHQHLASLQVASPTEGYPPQVVAIIALVVFIFTWLFF